MFNKKKVLILASIIIAMAAIFILKNNPLPKKSESQKTPQDDLNIVPEVKHELYIFKVEGFNKDSKLQWGLEGESANLVEDKINIQNLKAVYTGEEGLTFVLYADRAVYDKMTQDVELLENIVGESSDGGRFVTDYAKYFSKTEEITSSSHVTVTKENLILKGKGFVTKPRLKWVTFNEDVIVNMEPDRVITCTGPFEIDHAKNMAIFNDNVKVTDTDNETYTDKLTVYLNPETNQIERIITEGNVKIVHRGDIEKIGELSF